MAWDDFTESAIWLLLEDVLRELVGLHDKSLIYGHINPRNIVREGGRYFLRQGNDIYPDLAEYIYHKNSINPSWRGDLYSLGVTCLGLLTGVSPFDLYRDGVWVWRDYLIQPVSDTLGKTIDRLLEPDDWQSLDEVLTLVKQARGINYPTMSTKSDSGIEAMTSLNIGVAVTALATRGESLAVAKSDGTIGIYNLRTRDLKLILRGHARSVTCVCLSPDGVYGVSGSEDRSIKLWDISGGKVVKTFTGHTHNVTSVVFTADGGGLISGSWDKTVKVWDINSTDVRYSLTGHRLQVNSVSCRGEWFASGGSDRLTYIWRLSSASPPQLWRTLKEHTWGITALDFSADGRILATGSADNTIKLWDVKSGGLLHTFSGHSWLVSSLTFTEKYLISGSWDKTVKVWDVSEHVLLATFKGHSDVVTSVTGSGDIIISGGCDRAVKLWQYSNPK
ncbi:MAG: hypothetical protein N5P05_001786 [Chroococcopsis gigantea SAG 12.99]|jgi:WD40 repeat protein|nr:hypothetical protein [Chroococcopsis gigantea SAG 12.99]